MRSVTTLAAMLLAAHDRGMDSAIFRMAKAVARRVPGGMAIGRVLRRAIDPELRAVEALRAARDPKLLQPWPTTAEDRYPELFDEAARLLTGLKRPRVLSFGCATGEEVRAIKARLPNAAVTGIDINPRAIKRAKARDPQGDYRISAAVPKGEQYDLILALAVFRHGELEAEKPDDCGNIMPFAKFTEGMASLDAALTEGGVLALWNSHFRFGDLPVSANYRAEPFLMSEGPLSLLYGPENRRIDGASESAALFRKLSG